MKKKGRYLRAELAQRGVRDDKGALVRSDVLQRSVGGLALLVVQDSVTLREGTTLDILSRDTDMVTLSDEGTECQSLSGGPVDVFTFVNGLLTVAQDTLEVAVEIEAFGSTTDLVGDGLQQVSIDTGRKVRQDLGSQFLGGLEAVPGGGEPFTAGGLVVLAAVEAVVEHAPDPLLVLLDVLLGEGTLSDQLLDVLVELALLRADALVHQGLGEERLVGLVVAVLTVADNVHDDITLELGTPVSSNLADVVDSLDIVTVDVEDGSVDGLGNVGTVGGGTSKARISGETDLVVHDDVNGTTGGVGGQRVESQSLIDDSLGGEGGITVQQDTHGGVELLLVVVVVLDGTGLSEDNGVLSLQMGGVGDQRQLHALARGSGTLEVHTQVVLDITRTLVGGVTGAGELAEDGLVRLADDVGQNVQTTTVRHTNDDVLDTVVDTAVDQGLHTRHQALASLQTETLVVGELGSQERFEAGTPDETVEDAALLIDGVLVGLRDLEAVTDPVAGLAVRDVDVLDTVGAAVDLLARVDDLAQGHLLARLGGEARQNTRSQSELLVEIRLGESIVVQVQLLGVVVTERFRVAADTQRINLGLVVATSLVGANQQLDLQVLREIVVGAKSSTGHDRGHTTGGRRNEGGRRLESLGDGHLARLHVLEVRPPGDVHALRVFFPGEVHLVNVVGGVTLQERVVGVLSRRETRIPVSQALGFLPFSVPHLSPDRDIRSHGS